MSVDEDRTVLVESYVGDQAMTIVCADCATEAVIGVDDFNNEDLYACPAGCPGSAGMKYWQADACPNCKKLGFWDEALEHCCSRACMLQAEYARTLRSEPRCPPATSPSVEANAEASKQDQPGA